MSSSHPCKRIIRPLFRFEGAEWKKSYAVFNLDRRHFTPAFVAGNDLVEYEDTPVFDKERFEERVRFMHAKSEAKTNLMLIPRPSSRYCQVCKK